MKKIESNIFNIEKPNKKILAFITQGGHISGKIMKGIDFRLPKTIDELKSELLKDNSIGKIVETTYVIFIIYKKHYNTKINEKQFEDFMKKVSPQLNNYNLKITNEDLPQFKSIIEKYIPTIEYRLSSEWPHK